MINESSYYNNIRRRSQLLRERSAQNFNDQHEQWYVNERKKILRQRHGKHPKGTANSQWSQVSHNYSRIIMIKGF